MSSRKRWVAAGAVAAMLLAGGGLLTASAAGSSNASSFVPIAPCRLFDTRPDHQVGDRSTPLGPNETLVAQVWGANGNCNIPNGATGVSISVVSINPTAPSYLTIFPADVERPLASHLNWVAGQAPTPNAVTASRLGRNADVHTPGGHRLGRPQLVRRGQRERFWADDSDSKVSGVSGSVRMTSTGVARITDSVVSGTVQGPRLCDDNVTPTLTPFNC